MPPTTILIPYPRATAGFSGQEPKPIDAPTGGAGPVNPGTPGLQQDPNAPQGGQQPAGGFGSDIFLWMALFVGVMLFLSFRRESKTRKQQQAMLSSIKQGDRVVTSAGIHGVVQKLDDGTVTLMLDSAKVTFERSAIARIVRDEAEKTA